MYKIPFAISVILAFVLLYNILKIAFDVEDKNVTEVYKKARIKKKLFKNPRHIFSKYIKISNYKKQQYEADLFSLNMDITPQEYISESIFKFTLFIPLIMLFMSLEMKFLAILSFIISILVFLDSQNRLNRLLSIRRQNIEAEAPSMIRYFMVSLKNTPDIKAIFESYIEIAGYLKRDIELTVIDMNSMRNQKDNLISSLEMLDDRLNTPIMNDFITGLINVTMGKNQESYFALLERELKELALHNLQRKSNKVERLIKKYFIILIILFILITVAEFVLYIKASITF